jgi:hypothetical protein
MKIGNARLEIFEHPGSSIVTVIDDPVKVILEFIAGVKII